MSMHDGARETDERRESDGDGVDSEETEGDETQGDSNNDARKCRFGKIDGFGRADEGRVG